MSFYLFSSYRNGLYKFSLVNGMTFSVSDRLLAYKPKLEKNYSFILKISVKTLFEHEKNKDDYIYIQYHIEKNKYKSILRMKKLSHRYKYYTENNKNEILFVDCEETNNIHNLCIAKTWFNEGIWMRYMAKNKYFIEIIKIDNFARKTFSSILVSS